MQKTLRLSPNPIYGTLNSTNWCPKGKRVEFNFTAHPAFDAAFANIKVKIIYEMYNSRLPIDNSGYIELPFDIPSMQYTYFFIG